MPTDAAPATALATAGCVVLLALVFCALFLAAGLREAPIRLLSAKKE